MDFTKYEDLQIEEVCRICLRKKEQMSLFCESGVADMLLECASVQVTPEDGLFNLVCTQCANEVSRWYVFKQQVTRSFEIGRWLLEKKTKDSGCVVDDASEDKCDFKLISDRSQHSHMSVETSAVEEDVENIKTLIDVDTSEVARVEIAPVPKDDFTEPEEPDSFSSICDSTTATTDVKPTRKRKTSEDLICSICSKQCASTNSFNRHIKTHDDSRPFVCSKCDKPFKTQQVLTEHLKRHYDDRRHKCTLCGQKFYAKASLNDHMRSHTGEKPFSCKVCARAFATKAILRQHSVIHTSREKKFQCEVCSKFLLTAGSLETHKRKHSGIKPFQCGGCEKAFFTKEAMQRHFSAIHDTDNNFLCSMCSKVCSTKVHLNNHVKKKHLGLGRPANAICVDCGKQCGSAAELKVHVRVHTGERPYACDICDKRFIAKGNLNSHKQRHTGKKPFLCNHCGKAFGEKSTLKVHERIHTGEHPYKCNACNKSYIQSSALRTHVKSHWKMSVKY